MHFSIQSLSLIYNDRWRGQIAAIDKEPVKKPSTDQS